MPRAHADPLVALPTAGRVYRGSRRVRFGDLSPGGRLRLDAVARYLQDVSSDDTTDAGLADDLAWVVRRLVIEVRVSAGFREELTLATWCSGVGPRWAERRVSITGDRGGAIEAAVLWVHVDLETGRPIPLGDDFHALYGGAAGGRRVSTRLAHDPTVPAGGSTPWPLRFVDFDPFGHVNNASYWDVVEEALSRRRDLPPPLRAELEYRAALERHDLAELHEHRELDGSTSLWLAGRSGAGDPVVYATGRVAGLAGHARP